MLLSTGLFLVAGLHWVSSVDAADALTRYRAVTASARGPGTGVYRYSTRGVEHISLFHYDRHYSRETLRIVTEHGCGVREEQWFLVQHREYYDRCGSRLVAYGTDIAYWWTHGTQSFRCHGGSFDGDGLRRGQTVRWRCADEDTRAVQRTRYVGDERIRVAGRTITARHTLWVTDFTGATVGRAVVDDWFHPDTGVVLRERRAMGMRVGSKFVGKLDYTDRSTFTLISLTPMR